MASKPKTSKPVDQPIAADPLNVNARLYKQIARLLDDLEDGDNLNEITIPQRINSLIAVGRILVMFSNLRKAANVESESAGSAVRRYSAAFQRPYDAGRRAPGGRPAYGPVGADSDSDEYDDGPDAA